MKSYVRDSPWIARELIGSGALAVLGLIGLVWCWYGVAGEDNLDDQLGWLAGAVMAVIVAGAGFLVFLVAGFREVRAEARELGAAVVLGCGGIRGRRSSAAPARPRHAGDDAPHEYVRAPAMTLVHVAGCQLVRGKPARGVTAREASESRRCGVCVPHE